MSRNASSGGRSPSGFLVTVVVLGLTASLSGCAVVAETLLTTAAEKVADGERSDVAGVAPSRGDGASIPSDFGPSSYREGRQRGSVYVEGPVPGWERGPLLFGARSPFFAASPYRGRCRSLITLTSEDVTDPFGAVETAPLDLSDMGNNLGISPDYVPFGRVMLGGAGPQHYQWEPMALFSRSGQGCDFLWFRLISFGRDEGVETIHR